MRWWGKLLLVCLLLIALGLGAWWSRAWWPEQWRQPLLSPLGSLTSLTVWEQSTGGTPKRVLGFLPYWTMKDATASPALTDIAYFSVTLDSQGNLVERVGDERDQGYARLQSSDFETWYETARAQNQQWFVTITMMENDTISAFLLNESAQKRGLDTIQQLLASYPFDGVIIDIEYAGSADEVLRRRYAEFVRDVSQSVKQTDPQLKIGAAVFGSAASRSTQIWDIAAFIDALDWLVVMSYDYHVRSSSTVGPVAPIFGKGSGRWQDDVVSNMRDLLKVAPSEKILLGIAFYGYEWTATSENLGATTFPSSGATATYKRVLSVLSDPQLKAQERWDEDALSPYVVYQSEGKTQFIYYENARSLSYKLDFVQQLNLGGIAIWAMGYEGNNPELWQVVGTKLQTGSR